MKIQDNIGTMKMYPLVQYYEVTTNSRWRTVAIKKSLYRHISAKNHPISTKFGAH